VRVMRLWHPLIDRRYKIKSLWCYRSRAQLSNSSGSCIIKNSAPRTSLWVITADWESYMSASLHTATQAAIPKPWFEHTPERYVIWPSVLTTTSRVKMNCALVSLLQEVRRPSVRWAIHSGCFRSRA
jgi:hypothetical protein